MKTAQEQTVLQRQIDATDRQIDQLVYALYGLTDAEIQIVEDEAAILRYEELKKSKVKVGTNDLRIAATALERYAILVTRNQRDFRRIPGLHSEDWSK